MKDFAFDASEVIKEVKELKPGFEGRIKELKLAESKRVFEHSSVMQALTEEKRLRRSCWRRPRKTGRVRWRRLPPPRSNLR